MARKRRSGSPAAPAADPTAAGVVPAAALTRPQRLATAVGGIAVLSLIGFLVRTLTAPVGPGESGGSLPAASIAAPAPAPDAAAPAGFDKARAFADLEKQVRFGPRVPNTPGHRGCRDFLMDTLKPLADSVERQDLTANFGGPTLQMSNVIARWKGTGGKGGVLLCAHWDTRPTADQERTDAARKKPIPGANDGASGVAVLLEAARMFKRTPPPVPVMLVCLDGEDYGPNVDRMFLGSQYFADHLPADTPKRGILLDMVGDRDLVIPQEAFSLQEAKDVVDEVYAVAEHLKLGREFPARRGDPIEDDHLPLLKQGVKVIDLIDFHYGPDHSWWHTLQDTPDKCSPDSLKAVGDVVTGWVYGRR